MTKEVLDNYIKLIQERKDIKLNLIGVVIISKKKHYLVRKDGNKVGHKKYSILLDLYFRNLQLKRNINEVYGAYTLNSTRLCNSTGNYTLNKATREMIMDGRTHES